MTYQLLLSDGFKDYRLMDSGQGRKLEQFGPYLVDRPEPQAMWARRRPELWAKADAVFAGASDADSGRWKYKNDVQPAPFETGYQDVRFTGKFTSFRHMGYFPDQAVHWDAMASALKQMKQPKMLNLFGYTGVASLLAAAAGAEVVHVDASKKAIKMGQNNQKLSALSDKPIRWLEDDAAKFSAREVRRGNLYDGILVDPPKFGRGPKGEEWDVFRDLPPLLSDLQKILKKDRSFLILTCYAIRASALSFKELCQAFFPDARLSFGEIGVTEWREGKASSLGAPRSLATSLFVRVFYGM